MTNLKSNAEVWLKILPTALEVPAVNDSPLSRFFARECSIGSRLLSRITKDLSELVDVCHGSMKQTNELRALMSDLNRGMSKIRSLISIDSDIFRGGANTLAQVQDLQRHRCIFLHHRSRLSSGPTSERRQVDRLRGRHLAWRAVPARSVHHRHQTICGA